MMSILYNKAKYVAENFDVKTDKDCLVLFSISFLPTKENKDNAFNHIAENPHKKMIDHTPCGQKLEELNLFAKADEITNEEACDVWYIASRRLIQAASGNVTAFIDGAHKDSTFRKVELPAILANEKILTINFQNKWNFESLVSDHKDWYQKNVTSQDSKNKKVSCRNRYTR